MKKILVRIIGIFLFLMIISILIGCIQYYTEVTQDLSLDGITFYSVLILIIVFKLMWLMQESIALIVYARFNKKTKEEKF